MVDEHVTRHDQPPLVLLVDQDDRLRDEYAQVLTGAGFGVAHARDGAEALAKVRAATPAVVLASLQRPGKDLVALHKKIRKTEASRQIPVIALADRYASPLQVREIAQAGFDVVLRKPRDPAVLLSAIRETIRTACGVTAGSRQLRGQSAALRRQTHEAIERVAAALNRIAGSGKGPDPQTAVLREASAARDLMLHDRASGERLFERLCEYYGEHGVLFYFRAEAHRASGRRRLAHADFTLAVERLSDGEWKKRALRGARLTR